MNNLLTNIVSKHPSALATEDGSQSLTYNDLLRKADALGRVIQEHPLEPEEAVAIIYRPSIEMVIAQVALLRLNLICVPLDPGLPKLRIQELLGDIKVRYAIASTGFADLNLSIIAMPTMMCETKEEASSSRASLREITRSHILYTSGSTGKPKAVQITANSLLRLAQATSVIPLKATDRVALINNAGFDISLFEVWATLLAGATIVVVPRQTVIDPFAFRGFIAEKRLSVVFLTTSLFNATALACPTAFRNVGNVFTAGEVASPLAMRTVLESGGPPKRLWNTYGPTETTTYSTAQLVTLNEARGERIPIGQPSGDMVFLLDENLMPIVNNETPGEIFIGGPGISPGYVGRDKETIANFLNVPGQHLGIDTCETVRLYKTGDLGQWRDYSSQTLDFMGRVDRQVKQDGFRVELEEVEQILLSSDWFTAVVVQQLQKPEEVDPFFVAFVKSNLAGIPKRRVLDWASARMPPHMVPRDIKFYSNFPLTPNNKVDLKKLESAYWEEYREAQKKGGDGVHDSTIVAMVRTLWS